MKTENKTGQKAKGKRVKAVISCPSPFAFTRSSGFAKKGFTLLEIMIALAIIGGLLVTLLYSLNYHLGIAEQHEFITVATLLARAKLTEAEKNPSASKGNFPDPYKDYTFETTLKDTPYPGISEVDVSVSRGKESVRLSDLIEKKNGTKL